MRSTKVDAGDFKHELLNRLRSTMAVNVLICKVFMKIRSFYCYNVNCIHPVVIKNDETENRQAQNKMFSMYI